MEAGWGIKLQWVVMQRPADGMVTTVIATVLTSWGSTHSRILINCSFKKILTNFPPWQNSFGKNNWSHVFVCHLYCRWRGFWSPWSIYSFLDQKGYATYKKRSVRTIWWRGFVFSSFVPTGRNVAVRASNVTQSHWFQLWVSSLESLTQLLLKYSGLQIADKDVLMRWTQRVRRRGYSFTSASDRSLSPTAVGYLGCLICTLWEEDQKPNGSMFRNREAL